MNWPHVIALIYDVDHGPGVGYTSTAHLVREEDKFTITIEQKEVRFQLKEHHSTEESALQGLRPVTVTRLDTTQPRLRSTCRGRPPQSELLTAWKISSESTPCPARVLRTGGGIASCSRKTKRHSLP